jgi:hypothetical protein
MVKITSMQDDLLSAIIYGMPALYLLQGRDRWIYGAGSVALYGASYALPHIAKLAPAAPVKRSILVPQEENLQSRFQRWCLVEFAPLAVNATRMFFVKSMLAQPVEALVGSMDWSNNNVARALSSTIINLASLVGIAQQL